MQLKQATWVILLILVVGIVLAGCGITPPVQNNMGNADLRRGRIDDAIRSYQAAQVANPDIPVPYLNVGIAYLEAAEYTRAEDALQQALLTLESSGAVSAYFALGEVYFRQGRFAQAAAAYQQVLLRDFTDDDARYNMELALSLIPTETPPGEATATESDTENEQPDTPTASPSPTQSDSQQGDDPTPTSTPDPGNEPQPSGTPPTEPPAPEENNEQEEGDPSPMPQSEAEELLDDKQRQQSVLIPQEEATLPAGVPLEKDW
ncbi:MAG: tetratricopeptide repeat protein [Chloroflexota bacterium]